MSNFDKVLESCINIKDIERVPEDYIDEYLGNVQTYIGRILMVHPDPRGLQLFIPVTPGFSQVQEADSNIMKYEQGRVLAMVDAIILKDKRIQVWNVQEIKSKGFLIQMLK